MLPPKSNIIIQLEPKIKHVVRKNKKFTLKLNLEKANQ